MLNKVLSVFSFVKLQESITVYRMLQLNNLTMEDLAKHIEEKFKKEEERQEAREISVKTAKASWEAVAPVCPECKGYLSPPKHICKKKGPENLKGWTCLWFCNNGDCVYEKYTYEDAAEEMKKLMEKGRKE